MQLSTHLETFLMENLDTYCPEPAEFTGPLIEMPQLTSDPGNEIIFFAILNISTNLEINTRRLNNHLQEMDFANGDYGIDINPPIRLNSTTLLPITCLR